MANIKISELNELTQKANNDYVPIVDTSANETKKIAVESLIPSNVTLVAVSSTEPAECYTGDQYFNTTTNLIYTAIERNVWGTTGEQAKLGITYIVFGTQTAYAYDGTTLVSVGGGAGGGETLPVGSEIDFDGQVSDIPVGWEQVNVYSTTEVKTGDTWIDGKPIYRKVIKITSGISTGTTITTNISDLNIDRCINIKGFTYSSTFGYIPIDFYNGSNYNYVHTGGGSGFNSMYWQINIGASEVYFILEYTKNN